MNEHLDIRGTHFDIYSFKISSDYAGKKLRFVAKLRNYVFKGFLLIL